MDTFKNYMSAMVMVVLPMVVSVGVVLGALVIVAQ